MLEFEIIKKQFKIGKFYINYESINEVKPRFYNIKKHINSFISSPRWNYGISQDFHEF